MKVTCPITQVSYLVSSPSASPAGTKVSHPHPILSQSISVSSLVSTYLEPWAAGQLTPDETQLFGAALICKLPLARQPIFPTPTEMLPLWAKYIERLTKLAIKLEGKESKLLPHLSITPETIPSLPGMIDTLFSETNILFSPISEEAKKRNKQYQINLILDAELSTTQMTQEEIDSLILRGLKGSHLSTIESKKFPKLMASWAASVGQFPTTHVTTESGKKIRIDNHWKGIIVSAFSSDGMHAILSEDVNLGDIEDLLEHCSTEIPVGTIHASQLFKKLETLKEILEEFKGDLKHDSIVPRFKGTKSELAALLLEDDSNSESERLAKPERSSKSGSPSLNINYQNSSPSSILAAKLAAIRGKK